MKEIYLKRRQEELSQKKMHELPIADVWDRIAAFAVDLIIVYFSANILLASIKKKIEYAVLNENQGASNFYGLIFFFGACALFVFYHTVGVFFFKKTIGKKLFNLRTQSILGDHKISMAMCFGRATAQLVSLLLLGLPFLGVFSNKLRRPIHDRLSDTHIASLYKTGHSPQLMEQMWARITNTVVISQLLIFIIAQLYFVKSNVINLSELVTEPEYLCEEVSAAMQDWPEKDNNSRLEIALSLFGTNQIDRDCLDLEASRAIAYQEEMDNAYLAKAFVYDDQLEVSNEYLKKVCKEYQEGEACLVSQFIHNWSEKKYSAVDDLLEKNKNLKNSFSKIWAIKHYEKMHRYDLVLSLAESLWPNTVLNQFIGTFKSISYWNLGQPFQAEELFQNTYSQLSREQQPVFLAEMCHLEVENNCQQGQVKACQLLSEQMKQEIPLEYNEQYLLSYIKSAQCGLSDVEEISDRYQNFIEDPRLQLYLAGMKAKKQGKNLVAEQILKNVLKSKDNNPYLNYEIQSQLVSLATTSQDTSEYAKQWLAEKTLDSYHHLLGQKILDRLMQTQDWSLAAQVAKYFVGINIKSENLNKKLAVVFYNARQIQAAKEIVQKLEVNRRRPASSDEYDQIKKSLLESH